MQTILLLTPFSVIAAAAATELATPEGNLTSPTMWGIIMFLATIVGWGTRMALAMHKETREELDKAEKERDECRQDRNQMRVDMARIEAQHSVLLAKIQPAQTPPEN